MSTRTNLIAALLHILNRGAPRERCGVCNNVYWAGLETGLSAKAANAVDYAFEHLALYYNWPLWSGSHSYPVPHHEHLPATQATADEYEPAVFDMADTAYHALPKWSGPQLHLRRDFLYHCVKQLRKMTDKEVEAML